MNPVLARTRQYSATVAAAVLVALAPVASAAEAQAPLPASVLAALARAKVPPEALSVVVRGVDAGADTGLSWRAAEPVNPASLMKLVTAHAALELLGPSWTWSTGIWLQGRVRDPGPEGALEGDLVLKGSGDPQMVLERVWLLLRKIRLAGVREIRGDLLIDRSAFAAIERSPAEFDGEPLKPYNVLPDALVLNYRSLTLGFTPDAARGVARVVVEPALHGVRVDDEVPLAQGRCDDWRSGLRLEAADPQRLRLRGAYPVSCGERAWPMAYSDPGSYDARLIEALWRESGGRLTGSVRDGAAPSGVAPTITLASPPLAEVVRDMNKYSNNLMAEQLFLTLGLQLKGAGSTEAARAVLTDWLRDQLGDLAGGAVVDNGSGLSRSSRLSAAALARLLQRAWASPVMPEFVASLPISGTDGTLRRTAASAAAGRAHLKTGSLRDVSAIAGYLLAPNGRRYVLVAIVNHPHAASARPALDALVDWTMSVPAQSALRP